MSQTMEALRLSTPQPLLHRHHTLHRMHRTTLHSNPRFNPFIAAALSKPVETVSSPLLSSVESSPVSIPPLKVSSNSLQYPPGYLGAVPDRSYSDDGNVLVSPMLYLTSILTSKVYDVAKETPLELAPKLSERLGVNIWLKREDLQPVFSFKLRGAYNMMAKLPLDVLEKGVICSSAGNHAQGVALAAKRLNCNAVIAMPVTTPDIKWKSVERLGATVVLIGDSYDEAQAYAKNRAKEDGRTFIPPFDHPDVIMGQGTVGMEIVRQMKGPVHAIFVPVGGGGLIAGISEKTYTPSQIQRSLKCSSQTKSSNFISSPPSPDPFPKKYDQTQNINQTSNSTMSTQQDSPTPTTTKKTKNPFLSIITEPIEWLSMLSHHLNPSFIAGIFLIYGIGQGFTGSLFKLVSDYYWKDIQKIQPSTVQLYVGIYFIPWILKPIWGILTDAFPILGYRRRPYFVIAGVIGMVSASIVALGGNIAAVAALMCFLGVSASLAIADVTIDACIARNSIEVPGLAPDLQTLCGFCSSSGALIGFLVSGFFVHHLGPQGSLGLMAIFPALTIVLGFVIYDKKTTGLHNEKKQGAMESVGMTLRSMYKTIKYPQAWKPSLYMLLSLSLNVTTHEGHFYWYTDAKAGPAFSQEFVGVIYAIGAVASIIGVLIYHKYLKSYTFRNLIFYAQLLYATSGVLDLFFVLRWNLKIGIPDSFFVVIEETALRITGKLRWMPMMVLSTKLCPIGIEGTFFALLMCIDSIGVLISKWGGGLLLRFVHVTRTDFSKLWLAVLIRDILRFVTLVLVFLVPNVGPYEGLLPSEVCEMNKSDVNVDEETLELVPMNGNIKV